MGWNLYLYRDLFEFAATVDVDCGSDFNIGRVEFVEFFGDPVIEPVGVGDRHIDASMTAAVA